MNLIIDTDIEKSSKDDAGSMSNVQILPMRFSWGHTAMEHLSKTGVLAMRRGGRDGREDLSYCHCQTSNQRKPTFSH